MQELRSKNFITINQVLQEKQWINQLQNQLLTILNEKNQIEQQVNDARINLRQSLSNLINNEMIFSRRSCYVLEITPNNGQFVSQGSSIISLSEDSIESPKLVPVFIGSQDISQVSVGNSILATPRGFQRAEVGGRLGAEGAGICASAAVWATKTTGCGGSGSDAADFFGRTQTERAATEHEPRAGFVGAGLGSWADSRERALDGRRKF